MHLFKSSVIAATLLSAAATGTVLAQSPDEALATLSDQVLSTGPGGEEPIPAADITLSEEELAQISDMGATAAIVMHYGGNDWAQAQIDGLNQQFEEMGIEVIAVTDAGFAPEKQVSDIETILAQNPDIIVSIPTDPVATADAYRQAAAQGVELVFMDNVPANMEAGTDYVSVVSADNYGNGVASAHLMAKALDGAGQIGLVFHAADFFVTQQRYDAFKTTITENYPEIEIVDEQGIAGPDFTGQAERAASAMMTANPAIDGIWAVWDVPAEGVIAAARANGRDDLVITTIDLGENVAIDMARGGYIKGLGAQQPFAQGQTEAKLAGYALLGKEAPAYVALPALPVEQSNLLDAWETVYSQPAPDTVVQSMNQ
ncbi:substrate-binding domain-containing protein [Pelagibacterium halotolerans]|uniref:Inositol transport system sugar-binding protein n=1 Tax=Pelagibacterium halotolerans (strain DSM 22347 / JCM 15775 / CGMCC 1.7692 / B2) TaxID=1082931 RepID=G4RDT3_PELHB|nr:substrate-binding domain-containing protein [Pelagibacterium halotolerans]AEQ53845.1 inositol transport system sugar-binding protein [Pelagibacterium halotolerans B2]QJR20006.1 substrate-binding domain-containing protein [Pelagibacterium halotolerans]SEA99644.1 monosaccharide ABC transporter substrate-binding protein, CUT2 family [Pelagibacterium halotolerans]